MPWTTRTGHPSGRRWVNDVGRFRLTLTNLKQVLGSYKEARQNGETQEMSTRYAIHVAERSWHSDGGISLKRAGAAWRTNTRIDAGKGRLLRLIESTLHSHVTLQELDHGEPQELILDHLAKSRPRYYTDSLLAAKRYKSLWGNQTDLSEQDLAQSFVFRGSLRNKWLKIRRGRDLFLLWKFKIPEVLDGLQEGYIYDPVEISCAAYGCSEYCLPRRPAEIAYVKRWQVWWKENTARLDELQSLSRIQWDARQRCHVELEPFRQDLHPEILLKQAHELAERQLREHEAWIAAQPKYIPPVRDSEYPWVREIMQPVETKEGTLIPVTTLAELEACGNELHNCAASYYSQIQHKEMLLVYLQNGIKKALGSYDRTGKRIQLVADMNKKPSKAVLEAFSSVNVSWGD